MSEFESMLDQEEEEDFNVMADDDFYTAYSKAPNPYVVTDEEYENAHRLYGKFCRWEARKAAGKIRASDSEVVFDMALELESVLLICIQRYKLQKFMVRAIEYFSKYPGVVPAHHAEYVWPSLFYWQMRAQLGPNHGFRCGIHDRYVAQAFSDIDAPVDARYEPADVVAKYIERAASGNNLLQTNEAHEAFTFVKKVENGNLSGLHELRMRVFPIVIKLSDLPVKPSQHAPWEHDIYFKPYCARFILNASNKLKNYYMKRSKLSGGTPLDDLASVIPDTRPIGGNIGWSNKFDHIMRKATMHDKDPFAGLDVLIGPVVQSPR